APPAASAVPAVAARGAVATPDAMTVISANDLISPLPTSQCVAQLGIHCYSPLQYRVAYDLNPLYARGITGAGRTIVIVDSFGSPTIAHDLHVFDAQFGLPDPPSLTIDQFGTIRSEE